MDDQLKPEMVPNFRGKKRSLNLNEKYIKKKRHKETSRDRLLYWNRFFTRKKFGIWIQCKKCNKWRKSIEYEEEHEVPEYWCCSMSSSGVKGCDDPDNFDYEDFNPINFIPGSIVWAKLYGYPWWPGMIEIDPDTEEYYWLGNSGSGHYNVTFLDDKVSRAWVPFNFVRSYAHDPPRQHTHLNSMRQKAKYEHLRKVAEQKANDAITMSIKERLEKFSFAHRYNGKWSQPLEHDSDEDIVMGKLFKKVDNIDSDYKSASSKLKTKDANTSSSSSENSVECIQVISLTKNNEIHKSKFNHDGQSFAKTIKKINTNVLTKTKEKKYMKTTTKQNEKQKQMKVSIEVPKTFVANNCCSKHAFKPPMNHSKNTDAKYKFDKTQHKTKITSNKLYEDHPSLNRKRNKTEYEGKDAVVLLNKNTVSEYLNKENTLVNLNRAEKFKTKKNVKMVEISNKNKKDGKEHNLSNILETILSYQSSDAGDKTNKITPININKELIMKTNNQCGENGKQINTADRNISSLKFQQMNKDIKSATNNSQRSIIKMKNLYSLTQDYTTQNSQHPSTKTESTKKVKGHSLGNNSQVVNEDIQTPFKSYQFQKENHNNAVKRSSSLKQVIKQKGTDRKEIESHLKNISHSTPNKTEEELDDGQANDLSFDEDLQDESFSMATMQVFQREDSPSF